MQIDKALRIVRDHARNWAEAAGHLARANGKENIVERWLEDVDALETVCNEVERLRGELEAERTRRIRQVFEHR